MGSDAGEERHALAPPGPEAPPPPARRGWTWAATGACALVTFFTILWPARGLTFLFDDYDHVARVAGAPGTEGWLSAYNVHWMPLFLALLRVERVLFGGNHTWYLAVLWAIHVANVFVLGRLIAARTGDERAGALGALAFGLATYYRSMLWWVTGTCVASAFLVSALGFLAVESPRSSPRRVLVGGVLATFLAPLFWGSGAALGPALALEAWRRPDGRRAAVAITGAWGAIVALSAPRSGGSVAEVSPQRWDQLRLVTRFFVELSGIGYARNMLVPPFVDTPQAPAFPETLTNAIGLSVLYVGLVGLLLRALEPPLRDRLLRAQVYLLVLLGLVTLVRWTPVGVSYSIAAKPYYQYLPGLVWGTTVGAGAALAARRWPRRAWPLALALVLAWGALHARVALLDRTAMGPTMRRRFHEPEIVAHARAAVDGQPAPVYDAEVPLFLATEKRLSDVLLVAAPGTRVTWTREATEDSVAPLRRDPLLAEAFDLDDADPATRVNLFAPTHQRVKIAPGRGR